MHQLGKKWDDFIKKQNNVEMHMNCEQCLSKCKASCCGAVPFKKDFIDNNKPVRKIIELIPFYDDIVIPMTEEKYCPYLSLDFKCTIYNNRPELCKAFGSETHPLATCPYQDKNGRLRSRQERRALERKQSDIINKNI